MSKSSCIFCSSTVESHEGCASRPAGLDAFSASMNCATRVFALIAGRRPYQARVGTVSWKFTIVEQPVWPTGIAEFPTNSKPAHSLMLRANHGDEVSFEWKGCLFLPTTSKKHIKSCLNRCPPGTKYRCRYTLYRRTSPQCAGVASKLTGHVTKTSTKLPARSHIFTSHHRLSQKTFRELLSLVALKLARFITTQSFLPPMRTTRVAGAPKTKRSNAILRLSALRHIMPASAP